jgi:hypothetical protein
MPGIAARGRIKIANPSFDAMVKGLHCCFS